MSTSNPKAVFQTLRKLQLQKEELKKIVKQFDTDGVSIVINGRIEILDINTENVKDKKNINIHIAKAINVAIEAMQNEHFATLQNINI